MENKINLVFKQNSILLILFFSVFTLYSQETVLQTATLSSANDMLGWTASGSPSIGYSTEANRPGIILLRPTQFLISPIVDVTNFRNLIVYFTARTQGNPRTNNQDITVSISLDGGANYIGLDNNIVVQTTKTTSNQEQIFYITLDNDFSLTNNLRIRLSVGGGSTNSLDNQSGVVYSNIYIEGEQKAIWDNGWINGVIPTNLIPLKIISNCNLSELINASNLLSENAFSYLNAQSLIIGDSNNQEVVFTIDSESTIVLNRNFNVLENSSIIVDNGGNFIQLNSDVTNESEITVNRNTSPLKRLDYVLWSSPVENQNLRSFSPQTVINRFYTYNPLTDFYDPIDPLLNNFMVGKSYLIRVPNDFSPSEATVWQQSFVGVPHKGEYSFEVSPSKYYAFGNPYPATFSLDLFAEYNYVPGPFYFWRKTNNYNNPSYATYVPGLGGVQNTGGGSEIRPTGYLPPGQGFIFKTDSSSIELIPEIEEIFMSSDMLPNDLNSNVFLRTNNSLTRNRIWINLVNNNGLFSQALIAYTSNSTLDLDSKDALISGATASSAILSSVINSQPNYIIQGRGDFIESDVVPLSLKAPVAGDYTISLADFDGTIFENVEQDIYLKDNYTNTITNLKQDSYTFATNIGDFLNRFEILYQNTVLSNNDFNADAFIVYSQNDNNIVVNGANQVLSAIKIFDARGRLLSESKNINANEFIVNITASNELLLVQITDESGSIVTKKIIH